jgi:hypothetical protein
MQLALKLVFGIIVAAGLATGSAIAAGPDGGAANTIPPGTQITMQNWNQYKQFMPDGMVALFQGTHFWKMPPNVEIDVGPTIIHPLPKGYLDATEKYASQVKLVELPGGALTISGYSAGIPFPNPHEPHKAWKILANLWYRYTPRLTVWTTENSGTDCYQDNYGNISCDHEIFVDRLLQHVTDPGAPMVDPAAGDRSETRYGMVIDPEQKKYTAFLSIYYDDLTRLPGSFGFSPARRQVIQNSPASRCQPSAGADFTADDYRYGFGGNIPTFSADFIGARKILALLDYQAPASTFPANYFMPLGFPKPSWGKWELREVDILDVRKLPTLAGGYCYGKRVMYIDSQFYAPLWEELYDNDMKLWKIMHLAPQAMEVPKVGIVNNGGAIAEEFWDVQHNHATYDSSFDDRGHPPYVNEQVPKAYDDINKYSTSAGLSTIMR